MTKSRERGENELTKEARREAARTNRPICAILSSMLAAAKAAGDPDRIGKIIKAQKYMGCRNIRKRKPRR
jgi:hypothetical protein